MRNPRVIAAARSRVRPSRGPASARAASLLGGAALSTRLGLGEHLLHLPVEAQLLEEGALLTPYLVRDRGCLLAIFDREDVTDRLS
jgi:hypothetical protein